jgi:membrane carboxypeptidase/penicillin-binding protein PbpC
LGTPNALEIGRPVAAKIGQVQDGLDVWTIGASPQRVAVVWTGADTAFSPDMSMGIWQAVMKSASLDLPADGWELPLGVTQMDVCDPSGLLPTADCPNIVSEVFLNGSEPTQYDNLYRTFEVNRETGYLATVFTPLELIEERKYMIVPDEAREWAEEAGLPVPPTSYDAIQLPPQLPNAYITTPSLFADMRGLFSIIGTAGGEDFRYYRVSIGQGLNPQRWTQLGDDVYTPVQDDVLVSWDTSDLDGLFAIQLLVVYQDDRVQIATTQISVDNQAPTVSIIYPQEGEEIDYLQNRQMDFQLQVNDNLGIDRVEYFVDFQQIGVLDSSPYTWTWTTSQGSHHIKVIAYDRAGNSSDTIVRFKAVR